MVVFCQGSWAARAVWGMKKHLLHGGGAGALVYCGRGLVVGVVDGELWEGEVDAFAVECVVDVFVH